MMNVLGFLYLFAYANRVLRSTYLTLTAADPALSILFACCDYRLDGHSRGAIRSGERPRPVEWIGASWSRCAGLVYLTLTRFERSPHGGLGPHDDRRDRVGRV
jgi:hypothetical protein